MKESKFALLWLLLLFHSCRSSDFSQFQQKALSFSSDKHIDQKEYESLEDIIKSSNEGAFKKFLNDDHTVNNSKLVAYLIALNKKINMTAADIWQPGDSAIQGSKFNVNVYLENSASIDGYVGDNSTFKTTIFKLLADLKNFTLTDSLNLNYINTKPIPIKVSATRDDIQDFYKRLNPQNFRNAGGTRGSTDIETMLKYLLDNSNTRNLSVFISDCVFSPGKKDAKKYLDGQYASIYSDFLSAKTLNPGLSVVVLQCTAKFEGTYYDYFDAQHKNIRTDRPYYIWFLGTSSQIKGLVDYKIFDLIKNGYKNKMVIQTISDVKPLNYKILYRPRIGDFDSKSLSQGIIAGASPSHNSQNKGQFGFNVAVDFSNSLQDASYFLDTSNYKLSDKGYHLKVEAISESDQAAPNLTGFTHLLNLQTTDFKEETVKLDVVGKTPSWVYSSTSSDDTKIETDDSEKQKTFGFKYLVEGVCNAFYPKTNSNITSSISITIKK